MRLSSLLLTAALAAAAPASRTLTKRHSNCFSYSPQGCQYPLTGYNGGVASEVGTCSEIGIDIQMQGGNAADSMIATGLCVGVISGYHSGIGGGGFMLVRFPSNSTDSGFDYEMIDFRETLPAAGNATIYSQYGPSQNKSLYGGLAPGVPGDLMGWWTLHQRHGALPWSDLLQPAINLARNGFVVNYDLASELTPASFSWILSNPNFAAVYAPNGTLLGEGDTCYRKNLADTLEQIANEGIDAYYGPNSTIAQTIVKAVQGSGGIMTTEDIQGYKAIVRKPASIDYRGKKVVSTVAPSSGTVVLSALKIFEGYPGSAADTEPAINVTTHYLLEATQFAYGQRTNLADPGFVPNVTELEKYYLTNEVVDAARAKIVANETFPVLYYDPTSYGASNESGTSHMAAVDYSGMAVSLTTTVNTIWGSRVMADNGIILNNEMDDFGTPGQLNAFGFAAQPINYPAPGKRPLSSISSSIVEDPQTGAFVMATGSAGGSQIITATIQELYHHLDQGLNASQSTGHPRWHDQLAGKTIFEWPQTFPHDVGYDNSTVAYLKGLGYNVTWAQPGGSVSHCIVGLQDGSFEAAADPRRPAGYGAAW